MRECQSHNWIVNCSIYPYLRTQLKWQFQMTILIPYLCCIYYLIYGDCIPWTILLVTNSAASDCVLKMPAEGKPSYPHPQGTFLPLENLLQFDKVGNSLAKPITFTKNLPPSQKVFSSLTKCQLRVLWIVLLTMVVPLVSLFFFS